MNKISDFFKEYIASSNVLSNEELNKLIIQAQQGNMQARDIVIHNNIKLVKSIALRYVRQNQTLEDVMQEGIIGLIKSIESFNINRGFTFSTYATKCIEGEIKNSLLKSNIICFNAKTFNLINKMKIFCNNYIQEFNQQPSIEEISKNLKISICEVEELINIQNNLSNILSLDAPINSDEPTALKDLIEDKEHDILEQVYIKIFMESTNKAISNLTEQEKKVILLRLGNRKKITEIARALNCSINKVNNIERRAIKSLRKQLKNHKDN